MSIPDTSRVQRHFDKHSREYVEKYHKSAVALYRKKQAFLGRCVRYQRDGDLKVLDLGSGSGIWADLFLDEYPWAQLTCVDLSAVMLMKGNSRKGKHRVVGNASRLPLPPGPLFDLINLDALMHHLVDYGGFSATVLNIAEMLRSLRPLLKPGGKVLVREVFHESVVREDLVNRVLFSVSTARFPGFLESALVALGIGSQGAGVCFLTRRQWYSVVGASGYEVMDQQEFLWKQPLRRKLAGLQSSGNLFLLLATRRAR